MGCPKSFSTSLGLRTHMRSCISKRVSRGKVKKWMRCTLPKTLGGIGNRLACDDLICQMVETDAETLLTPCNGNPDTLVELDDIPKLHVADSMEKKLALTFARVCHRTGTKSIDEVLKILQHPEFNLPRFQSNFVSAKDCLNLVNSEFSLRAGNLGFQCLPITEKETGVCYEFYMRSAVDVLRSQIKRASCSTTFFDSPSTGCDSTFYFHPMTAKLGREVIPVVQEVISSSDDPNVFWHTPAESGQSSFVGLIQIYSDKSRTTLKESGFQFHPVHINLLNFSEEHRRNCIVNGLTFVGFLPVNFYQQDGNNWVHTGISREIKLKVIHEALSLVLNAIKEVGLEGFSCLDKENKKRRCHPCIALYTCDLPEGKDMTSVRNGNSSQRNCHRCLAKTSDFNLNTSAKYRVGVETRSMIIDYFKLRQTETQEKSKRILNEFSLFPQVPWLLDFPFIGLHESIDLHSLFGYEVLHGLHLGISKDLKRCLSERLRSATHFTKAIPTRTGKMREASFKAVRSQILSGVNKMLSHMARNSPASGLRIDFSSGKDHSNGLYGEDGSLIGMLEGKDYKSLDMVAPFIGAFVDRCCGEIAECVNTKVLVLYSEMVAMMLCYDRDIIWNAVKLDKLRKLISTFKQTALSSYGEYQPSRFRTEKFHLLDHVCEDIERLGGLQCGDAGLYEYSHTMVKTAYRSTSGRKHSAMRESILSFMQDLYVSSVQDWKGPAGSATHLTKTREEAIDSDAASLVKTGEFLLLDDIEKNRKKIRQARKEKEMQITDELPVGTSKRELRDSESRGKYLVEDIGEEAARVVQVLLREKMNCDESFKFNYRLCRVSSGFVSGRECPTGKDYDSTKTNILFPTTRMRRSQRFVSQRNYYNKPGLRQDCLMIEGAASNSGESVVWIAKALALFRLYKSNRKEPHTTERNKSDSESEFAFVQYFNVVPPRGELDSVLGCVRLEWAKDQDQENGNVGARKWYDLVPIEAVRGVVHVVRGDYGVNGTLLTKDMEDTPWTEQFFYLNRFYFDSKVSDYCRKEDHSPA